MTRRFCFVNRLAHPHPLAFEHPNTSLSAREHCLPPLFDRDGILRRTLPALHHILLQPLRRLDQLRTQSARRCASRPDNRAVDWSGRSSLPGRVVKKGRTRCRARVTRRRRIPSAVLLLLAPAEAAFQEVETGPLLPQPAEHGAPPLAPADRLVAVVTLVVAVAVVPARFRLFELRGGV